LDALDYLHTQDPQIIHRDIKPQNLKLTARGQIILLDFGLAKGQVSEISRVTTSASIFGYTPNYAPLEQIQGLGTDARSDIYALGATLYHLFTGLKPPDALTRAAALVNSQPDPLEPANQVNPAVSPKVAAVLEKSMAQNRDQRYASAAAMRKDLQGATEATTVAGRSEADTVLFPAASSTITPAGRTVPPQRTVPAGDTTVVRGTQVVAKKRIAPWAFVAAAAVLLCSIGGFYAYRRNSSEVSTPTVQPERINSASVPAASPSQSPSNESETKKTAEITAPQPTKTKPEPRSSTTKPAKERATAGRQRDEAQQLEDEARERAEQAEREQREEREDPDVPNIHPRGVPRPPRIRRSPDGSIVHLFPDGSQLVTTRDGTRVFVRADGARVVLGRNGKVKKKAGKPADEPRRP
jgi:serine/threonine protein kinase